MTETQSGPLPPGAGITAEIRRRLRDNWGWLMALGFMLLIGGTAAVLLPVAASLAVELTVGVVMLFAGGVQAVHAWRCDGWNCRAWAILSGLLYLVGGAFLLLNPLAGILALTTLMIFVIGVDGVFRTIMALQMRPDAGWGWLLFGGLVSIAIAVALLFMFPAIGLTALGIFVGISLIFEGWGFVFLALAARRDEDSSKAA